MSLSINMIINIILLTGVLLTYLVYRNIKRKQKEDPEYQQRLRERQMELDRAKGSNNELDEYLSRAEDEDEE